MKYLLEGYHYKRGNVFYGSDATLCDEQIVARVFTYQAHAVYTAMRLNSRAGDSGVWWDVLPIHIGDGQ